MDGDFQPSLDDRRARSRMAAGARAGGSPPGRGRLGCPLMSLAAVAVIIALAFTGVLEQSMNVIRGQFGDGRKAGAEFMMRNNCRQLLAALALYANEHGGSYPDDLYGLAPDPLSDIELDRLLTEGAADSTISSAWILSTRLTNSSAATEILLLSVRPVSHGRHVAGLNDGSVVTISVAEAAEHLSCLGL